MNNILEYFQSSKLFGRHVLKLPLNYGNHGSWFIKKSLKSENHPFHAKFKKKNGNQRTAGYVCFKTLKEPPGFMKEAYGYLDRYLTFSPKKVEDGKELLSSLVYCEFFWTSNLVQLWLCLSFFFSP